VHLDGKEPRAGRQVGHVTVLAGTGQERDERVDAFAAAVRSGVR